MLVLWCAFPAQAASRFTPGLKWKTVTTDHFFIHYPAELAALAEEYAGIAEAVYDRQTDRLGWLPGLRTHVVLSDQADRANGAATPLPYNTIYLNASPPDGDAAILLNITDWRYHLFLHEYTHILHLDRAVGDPMWLRTFFGRLPLAFPNVFAPFWMLEGMATFEETAGTAGGRGRGAFTQGMLRTQALEDKLIPATQGGQPLHIWPGGSTRYLYGVRFLMDLETTYGTGTPARLIDEYSNNLMPFRINRNLQRVTGKGLIQVWDEWLERLRMEAHKWQDNGPTTAAERLTTSGFSTGGARVSPDGRWIAYSESTAYDHRRILLRPTDDSTPVRELHWRNSSRDLSWSADGQSLLFSQLDLVGNFKLVSDLYLLSVKSGHVRRLTRGLRLREAHMAADGRIVAVQNSAPRASTTRLVLFDSVDAADGATSKRPGTMRVLFSPEKDVVFADPRFSPDGATVAVSALQNDQRDILLIDVATGQVTQVTDSTAQDAQPSWSPDGATLLFSSDRSGTFDLMAMDIASGDIRRVTRLPGGGFAPEVAPATGNRPASLLYSGLSGDGLDLYRMPYDPNSWTEAPQAGPRPDVSTRRKPVNSLSPRRYNPFPALLPRFWVPVAYEEFGRTYWGAATAGSDPLGHHIYGVTAATTFPEYLTEAFITYQYDGWWPTLQMVYRQDHLPPPDPLVRWWRRQELVADLLFPINHFNQQQQLLIGVDVDDRNASLRCTFCSFAGERTLLFARLGLIHNSGQFYGLGISPTDGRRIALTSEISLKGAGSDLDGSATVLNWREYIPMPKRGHVLQVRLTGAKTTNQIALVAGGTPNGAEGAFNRDFAVRGYADLAFRGQQMVRSTVAYQFPLALPNMGVLTWPLFIEKLHGNLFLDHALVRGFNRNWNNGLGGGAEIGIDMAVGYFVPLTVRLGVATGKGHRGTTQVYLRAILPNF